jgi:hypothetical protein
VTFDTNALDKVVRPERFPKDPDLPAYGAVRYALRTGAIAGFFSDTAVTLEGIQRDHRAEVLGGTRVRPAIRRGATKSDGPETFQVNLSVWQPARRELHAEQAARFTAALELGLRLLNVPRIAMTRVEDPDGTFYAETPDAELEARLDLTAEVAAAIDQRGLGFAQAVALGQQFAAREGLAAWLPGLGKARDVHELRAVARAVAEWADGDSVAAHVAYKNEVFCSDDEGKSAGISVLSPDARKWLTDSYGVRFVTLAQLANLISAA